MGANPATFTGDFINFQVGGASKFKVDATGKVTGDGSGLSNITTSPGGSNTSVQFNDNGALAGASGLYWDKAQGYLGIGAAPNTPLWIQLNTSSPFTIANPSMVSGNTMAIRLTRANTVSDRAELAYTYNSVDTDQAVHLRHSGGGSLTLLKSGNVGVGTTVPSTTLHVSRNTNGANTLFVENPNTGASAFSSLSLGNSSSNGLLVMTGTGNGDQLRMTTTGTGGILYNILNNSGDHVFKTTASEIERLRITSSGYVGIGSGSAIDTLSIITAPIASATRAQVNFSNTPLSGGSASGTYLGMNPGVFTGDFINFQVAGVTKFKVDATGKITGDGSGLTGVSSSPAGVNRSVQFNNSGVTAGASALAWDETNWFLNIGTGGILYSYPLTVKPKSMSVGFNNVSAMGGIGGTNAGQLKMQSYWDGATAANRRFSLQAIDGTDDATPRDLILQKDGGSAGVGTTAPSAKFEVTGVTASPATSGSAADSILRISNTTVNQAIDFGNTSGGFPAWIQVRDKSNYANTGFSNLVINPNGGTVGVGGSMNAAEMILSGYNTANGILGVSGVNTASGQSYGVLAIGNNASTTSAGSVAGRLVFSAQNNSSSSGRELAEINTVASGSGGANGLGADLILMTKQDNVLAKSEKMRILANGNVGIGTTSPSAKLQVAGSIVSNENVVATGGSVDFSTGNTQILQDVQGSTLTLSNMVNGGNYTIIVTDVNSRVYSFSGCTPAYFSPALAATTQRTVFSILKTSQGCFITWTSGFN